MARRRVSSHEGFLGYMDRCRPLLQQGYDRVLSALLDGVAMKERGSVMDALKAGKKIRGCLACLACEAAGGPLASALPRAVAIELIQAATLIHDDFVDQDRERGGRPAVWTMEGPQRAVLIGDVMFAAALEMMSSLGPEDGRIASRAIAETSKGALHEPLDPRALADRIASDGLDEGLYEKIIRLKTGVLFAAACTSGCLAAGADTTCLEAWGRYGLLLGEAYQIADDVAEMRAQCSGPSLQLRRAAALAPALLRFATEGKMLLAALLGAGGPHKMDGAEGLFGKAAALMEDEIEKRLRSALSALEGMKLRRGYRELVRRTPRDIIALFQGSCGPC